MTQDWNGPFFGLNGKLLYKFGFCLASIFWALAMPAIFNQERVKFRGDTRVYYFTNTQFFLKLVKETWDRVIAKYPLTILKVGTVHVSSLTAVFTIIRSIDKQIISYS